MDPSLKNQIDSDSLNKFSKIASQCLQNNRKRRPSMRTVVKKLEELEKVLELQQQQDTDPLSHEIQAAVDGASTTVGETPNGTTQFKRVLDDMQNHLLNSSTVKTKKRVVKKLEELEKASELQQRQDSVEQESFKPADQHESEHELKSEIAKFTKNGGLVDSEGVEKLIELMQLESRKKNMDIVCRSTLAAVISVTDNKNCLTQFVKNEGLNVLSEWLQEVNKGNTGDGTSNNSIEEFLSALLGALDVLPVDLRALQLCNVGKNVNHLHSHKNPDILTKSRSLVDKWKRRVEDEMNMVTTQSGISGGGPWPNKSVTPLPPSSLRPQQGGLSNLTVTGMKKALDSLQQNNV